MIKKCMKLKKNTIIYSFKPIFAVGCLYVEDLIVHAEMK